MFAFFQNLSFNTYLAQTDTPGGSGHDMSYRAQLDYNGDRYGVQLERLSVDEGFQPRHRLHAAHGVQPELGVPRGSARGPSLEGGAQVHLGRQRDYITDPAGTLESRNIQGAFRTELERRLLPRGGEPVREPGEPFPIESAVSSCRSALTAFASSRFGYTFGPQREGVGFVTVSRGRFYNGTRTGITTERRRGSRSAAALDRAERHDQLDHASRGKVHASAVHAARHLHVDAAA